MTNGEGRRQIKDRRANDLKRDQAFPCNRRFRPCRRLNNISVEEVPMDTFIRHPYLWLKFHAMGYRKKDNKNKK